MGLAFGFMIEVTPVDVIGTDQRDDQTAALVLVLEEAALHTADNSTRFMQQDWNLLFGHMEFGWPVGAVARTFAAANNPTTTIRSRE